MAANAYAASQAVTPRPAAGEMAIPTADEATQALVKLLGLSDMTGKVTATPGTCVRAIDAAHAAHVACTVAFHMGAGTSETQADSFLENDEWTAQPSSSQAKLPFPEPALLKPR